MKLEFLDIRSLPGIHPGFRIDGLLPAANFITGPNASGKSSTIRAMRYLLTPPSGGDPGGLNLMAGFRADGQHWLVRRQGGRIDWEIDGQPADRPTLPDGDALGSYLVTVEDLFRLEGDNERQLSERLRRELNQGYDLEVLREGHYQIKPQVGGKEQQALRRKHDELHRIEADQRAVSEEEKRLPRLREQINQDRAARHEVPRLKTALELVDAHREASELETRLSSFPQGMDKLRGNEAELLKDLEETANDLSESLQARRRSHQQARESLAESGLAEGGPGEDDLDLQQRNVNRLETTEDQLEAEQESLADARVALGDAQRRLQLEDIDTKRLPEPDADTLREAQDLAIELETHHERKRRLEQQIEDADESVDEQTIDRHQRAIHALRDWLTAPASSAPDLKLPGLLGAGGVIAALAGGITGMAGLTILGAALMALALGLAWTRRPKSDESPRERAESQLKAQGIDGPEDWSRDKVQQRLSELERGLAALRLATQRQQRASEFRSELGRVDEALSDLQNKRRKMAGRIGFDPALTTRAMAQFLGDLEALHQARLALARSTERSERLASERTDLLGEIQGFLDQWLGEGAAEQENAERLAVSLRRLQQRHRQAREARDQLERTQGEIERLENDLEASRGRIDTLYRNAGLQSHQRDELDERLRRLEDWQELSRKRRNVQDTIAVKREQLEERPDLLEKAQSEAAEQLESGLEQARERADRLEDLREEKGQIEARIDQTGRDHAREKALAEVSLAQDQLETIRNAVIDAEMAHFLLDEVENEHRQASEPPLIEKAREFFQSFTHHEWDLEFIETKAKDEIGFRGRDLKLGEPRKLSELSTATRMQLLLALRMGQIELQEQSGPALPLIIDEALTTSDHERAGVIMRSLQELADEQHRQVLYVAAGDYEYRLWEHATGKSPNLIDLGEVRQQMPEAATPAFELPERQAIPAPEGMSAAEYATELDVPPLNPRQPAESTHVFHLLHDRLERLHDLMDKWRITTLGQLENLLDSAAARHAIPDEDERDLLRKRCNIARDWIELWRIGRGKRVDRSVLEEADGITDKTIDRVGEKADEVGQDARALIRALQDGEVHRYHSGQREALKEWLLAHGYLPEREPLMADERRQRVLIRLSGAEKPEAIHEHLDWLENAQRSDQEDGEA